MSSERVAALRTRATLARRLASEFSDPKSVAVLREAADAFDEEADKLENNIVGIEEAARRNQD